MNHHDTRAVRSGKRKCFAHSGRTGGRAGAGGRISAIKFISTAGVRRRPSVRANKSSANERLSAGKSHNIPPQDDPRAPGSQTNAPAWIFRETFRGYFSRGRNETFWRFFFFLFIRIFSPRPFYRPRPGSLIGRFQSARVNCSRDAIPRGGSGVDGW